MAGKYSKPLSESRMEHAHCHDGVMAVEKTIAVMRELLQYG